MKMVGLIFLYGVIGISLVADILARDLVSSLVVLVLLGIAVVLMATKRYVSSLSWLIPVMLLLYGAGSYLHLFVKVDHYDKVVHTYSAFLMTYISAVIYKEKLASMQKKDAVWYILAIASFGLAIGALWEIFEYFIQFPVHEHLNLGTLDTVTDLIADAVGAMIGGLISWKFLEK